MLPSLHLSRECLFCTDSPGRCGSSDLVVPASVLLCSEAASLVHHPQFGFKWAALGVEAGPGPSWTAKSRCLSMLVFACVVHRQSYRVDFPVMRSTAFCPLFFVAVQSLNGGQ